MNPMIRKELRQRMRERKAWILPVLYLLVLAGVVSMGYLMATENAQYRSVQGYQVGITIYLVVLYTELSVLMLLAPIFSAGAVTIEKEQRTLGSLLTTLLSPQQIWTGKFGASFLFLAVLLVAGVPILGLAFALGGVGPRELLMATFSVLLALTTFVGIGLYCSVYFRRSVHATAVSYIAIVGLSVVSIAVVGIVMALYDSPSELPVAAKIAFYFNPYYMVTMSMAPWKKLAPDWATSAAIYAVLAACSWALAVRGLRRAGEQL